MTRRNFKLHIFLIFLLTIAFAAGSFSVAENTYAASLNSPTYKLTQLRNGVKVSWSKVEKAKKYKVYRRVHGVWHVVKTKKAGTSRYYIDSTATKCGSTYRYQVRAVRGSKYSKKTYAGKKLKRKHYYVLTKKKAATCKTKPRKYYTCSLCGVGYSKSYGTRSFHSYGNWITVKKATATTEGLRKRICKKCGTVAKAPVNMHNVIVNEAIKHVGGNYKLHGTNFTTGIDCSHFVYRVLKNSIGFSQAYRTSSGWVNYGTEVSSIDDLKAGDIIVFKGHIVIYMSKGRVIHSSRDTAFPNGGIIISKFTDSYGNRSNTVMIRYFEQVRKEKFLGIRRFLNDSSTAATSSESEETIPAESGENSSSNDTSSAEGLTTQNDTLSDEIDNEVITEKSIENGSAPTDLSSDE